MNKHIVHFMHIEASKHGQARHRLKSGLIYTLTIRPEAVMLSLTRLHVYPTPQEEATSRDVFNVPAWAGRSQFSQGNYHIIRLIWTADPPPTEPAGQQLTLLQAH